MYHHALGEQGFERFLKIQVTDFLHGAHEKARIQQMQNGMLYAADILIHRHPVARCVLVHGLVGMRRAEPGKIPRRIDESVKGIGFAASRTITFRARNRLPLFMPFQRIAGLVKVDILRQHDGEICKRDINHAALVTVNKRDRAAPVALA